MFDFWARVDVASCSLARIQRGASARLARMTALLLEIFVISTGVLTKNAVTELCQTQNVHTIAKHSGYWWQTTNCHIISIPCQFQTILIRSNTKKLPSNAKPNVQVNYFLGMLKPKNANALLTRTQCQTQRQAAETPCLVGGPLHNEDQKPIVQN